MIHLTKIQQKKIEKIIKHHGAEAQQIKTLEELSELMQIVARGISDDKRNPEKLLKPYDYKTYLSERHGALKHEIADVIAMCVQLCLIYGFCQEEINDQIILKITNTLKRIAKDKKTK